jgi:hypothetical protein
MPFEIGNQSGKGRRVLADIKEYPTPGEMQNKIASYEGNYKTRKDFYTTRDRALASILYIAQLRKSELHRLTKQQFKEDPFRIVAVELSKSEKRNKKTGEIITRKDAYRKQILIPVNGKLRAFGKFVQEYLSLLDNKPPTFRLFPFSDKAGRDNQILKEMLGYPPHWERAFGENLLYELFDYDLIAVANYVQVDPRTLSKYIHRTPKKYLKKLK